MEKLHIQGGTTDYGRAGDLTDLSAYKLQKKTFEVG